MHSVVLGIGNVLLTDEGAGVHAVRRVAALLGERPDVAVIDGGTLSFTLAPAIECADRLIVLDAAELRALPGTMRTFFDVEMDRFLGRGRRSVHEVSLIDLLDVARLAEACPPRRVLIGIQPRSVDWGEQPTPEVAVGIEQAAALAASLVEAWPDADPSERERRCDCVEAS
jgi:hydrogenase maturation protease